ncbi:MAG: glycosyltransferase [Richelia sp. RM2_1_2]|nr:glycosyltransferase [Richelia sp. RM1_1_1]NJO62178.1 glycosyltransferase [Richelia sp. RM2_1_2]
MNYSPIALFIYKRPEHTRRTLESLMQCPEFADSPLYVFCDGAKKEEDKEKVMQAREVARSMVGAKAEIIESPTNRGLANSIISGVTNLCDQYQRVIVVEDDLVVAPQFLSFLNAALEKYQEEHSVMQVSGHMFSVPEFANRNEAVFLPFTTSWGWATWKRAWDYFDAEASGWEVLKTDKQMQNRFNLDGCFDSFKMLKQQMSGEVDSWAIRWYWSVFKNNGCVVYPPSSYVNNIGFDGSGTHGSFFAQLFLKNVPEITSSKIISLPKYVPIKKDEFNIVKIRITKNRNNLLSKIKKLFFKS